jgi:hypothetical protein
MVTEKYEPVTTTKGYGLDALGIGVRFPAVHYHVRHHLSSKSRDQRGRDLKLAT